MFMRLLLKNLGDTNKLQLFVKGTVFLLENGKMEEKAGRFYRIRNKKEKNISDGLRSHSQPCLGKRN